jgi:uncharacterized membrane protein
LTKPRIQIQLFPFDKTLERIGVIILVLMWGLTVYMIFKLPQTIPVHFNFSGEPDRYGNKVMILVLPIFGAAQFFLFTWLNKFPHIFNYPIKITEDNAEKQYLIATRMLRVVKVSVLILFTGIVLIIYLTTFGFIDGLGSWFVPVIIGVFLIATIITVIRSLRQSKISK